MDNRIGTRVSEKGSAIVYVFIGVALFGTLMFLFSRGASQNSNTLSDQQYKVTVSEMVEYGRKIEGSVQRLLMKGCSENEISFDNDLETGYTNPASPPDKSCWVFDAAGGRMKYTYPPVNAATTYTATPQIGYRNYGFNGNMRIEDLGTTSPELIMWTMTNKGTCDQFNASIGKTTADDNFGDGIIGLQFTGAYQSAGPGVIGDDAYPAALSTGCLNRPTYPGQYIFYMVLNTR